MRNEERELKIAIETSSNGHRYIFLTAGVLSINICDRMALIDDCYIHHRSSMDVGCTLLIPDFSLEEVNESDENIKINYRPQ